MQEHFYKTNINYPGRLNFVDQVIQLYQVTPVRKPDFWLYDDVFTTITYNRYKSLKDYTNVSMVPDDLVELLEKECSKFISLKDLSGIGRFSINEMWINCYGKSQYQCRHKHHNGTNTFFSGVYFAKFNPLEHIATRFYNPAFEVDFDVVTNHPLFTYSPSIEEGDLLIFPAAISHDVPLQPSNELRITVSFNVMCDFLNYS